MEHKRVIIVVPPFSISISFYSGNSEKKEEEEEEEKHIHKRILRL